MLRPAPPKQRIHAHDRALRATMHTINCPAVVVQILCVVFSGCESLRFSEKARRSLKSRTTTDLIGPGHPIQSHPLGPLTLVARPSLGFKPFEWRKTANRSHVKHCKRLQTFTSHGDCLDGRTQVRRPKAALVWVAGAKRREGFPLAQAGSLPPTAV